MTAPNGKVFALVITMVLGVFLPQLYVFTFLIRYLLMLMLFFAFVDMQLRLETFRLGIWRILLANLAIAFLSYLLLSYRDPDLAVTAFLTGIAPTATASPVLISMIGRHVPFVAAAVLLTNVAAALVIPFALPGMVGAELAISTWQVLQPVLVVMLVPLVLARAAGRLPDPFQALVRQGKRLNFLVWLLNLLIVSANASHFVRYENDGSAAIIVQMALLSLAICAANFAIGALIGRRGYRVESSQALGQKNNSFIIWVALTFINPLAALGPTFYILYQNLYNSWLIYQAEKRPRPWRHVS